MEHARRGAGARCAVGRTRAHGRRGGAGRQARAAPRRQDPARGAPAGRPRRAPTRARAAAPIRLRAERLTAATAGALEVPVLAETDLDTILATLRAERPEVCVIDSVQTLHASDLTGAPRRPRPGRAG